MSKKGFALAIRALDAPWTITSQTHVHTDIRPIPPGFFNVETKLLDRDVCEDDTSHLQLLPYMTLMNEKDEVFVYTRGKAGGEAKLHGKLSVGVGGHVETSPALGVHLYEHLQAGAAIEHQEEVGRPTPHKLDMTHYLYDPVIPPGIEAGKVHVGLVHLGLWGKIYATDDSFDYEKGIIEKGTWMHLYELMAPEMYRRLEPWSQVVVGYMYARRQSLMD